MLLLDLPHELLLDIWDALETTRDMNAFAQTCRYCYDTFNPRLYHWITGHWARYHPFFNWLAVNGPVEALHHLLDAGVDPSPWGMMSPLEPAAMYGREDLLQVLLKHGFDPNISGNDAQTPLHLTAINGFLGCARMLVDAGAHLDYIDDNHRTPASCAVFNGHADVFALLLDHGASMDNSLFDDETPLSVAARLGFKELVTLLLERNAPVDGINDEMEGTPLAWAARSGHLDIVRQLLDAGADVNATTSYGQGPLHWAALGGYEDVVALLLEEGAAADETDVHGNTPLSRACVTHYRSERVIELLLEANANANIKNSEGKTTLSIAAERGFSRAIRFLLEHGADPTIVDDDGLTPLAIAARNGHAQTVLEMLDYDAPSSTEEYDMPYEGKTVSREIYIDAPDRLNRTPLFFATLYGYEEVVRILLSRGSSAMYFATSAGRTPISVAQDHIKNLRTVSKAEGIKSIWACLCDPSHIVVNLGKVEAASRAADDTFHDMACDSCTFGIPAFDTHYHCTLCLNGNYDLCLECVATGQTCGDPTHSLLPFGVGNSHWTAVPDAASAQLVLDFFRHVGEESPSNNLKQ